MQAWLARGGTWLTVGSLAVALAIAALLLWPHFDSPGWVQDEGILLVYPELTLMGWVPYRDFESLYGPGNLWVLAAAYKLFGVSVTTERAVGLVYRLAIVAGVFVLGRRQGIVVGLAAGLLAASLLPSLQLPAFAWLGGLALALWGLVLAFHAERHSDTLRATACWFGAGWLSGLALLFRPDLALAVGPAAAISWLSSARKHRLWYVAGAGLALLPYAGLLVIAGPAKLWQNLVIAPAVWIQPGRRLPFPTLPSSAALELWGLLVATAGLVLVGMAKTWRGARRSRHALTLALFAAGILPQALQRADLVHLRYVTSATFAIIPVVLIGLSGRRTRAAVTVAAVVIAVIASGSAVRQRLAEPPIYPAASYVRHDDRAFPVDTLERAEALRGLLLDLDAHASPGARLLVGPGDLSRTVLGDTFLYYLVPGLVPATYYLEMNPGSANRPNSGLAADVAAADLIVLNRDYEWWGEPNAAMEPGSEEPMRVLASSFCEVAAHGNYRLYQHCE